MYARALSVPAPLRVAIVEDDDAIRVLIEDLYWSLLSSKEFLFNH